MRGLLRFGLVNTNIVFLDPFCDWGVSILSRYGLPFLLGGGGGVVFSFEGFQGSG